MIYLALFLALLWPTVGRAAVAYDAQCSGSANAATSTSCSITVGSLTDGVMYIAALNDQEGGDNIATPTVGGSSTGVTLVDSQVFAFGTDYHLKVYRLKNPSSGAQTVAFSNTGTANLAIGVVTYSGVDQTTPDRTPSKTTGTSTTPSLSVTTTSGDVVAEFFWFIGNNTNRALTFDGSQASRVNRNTNTQGVGISDETSSGASVTASGTLDFSGDWMIIGVPMIAASGGGATAHALSLMGVGQ